MASPEGADKIVADVYEEIGGNDPNTIAGTRWGLSVAWAIGLHAELLDAPEPDVVVDRALGSWYQTELELTDVNRTPDTYAEYIHSWIVTGKH